MVTLFALAFFFFFLFMGNVGLGAAALLVPVSSVRLVLDLQRTKGGAGIINGVSKQPKRGSNALIRQGARGPSF